MNITKYIKGFLILFLILNIACPTISYAAESHQTEVRSELGKGKKKKNGRYKKKKGFFKRIFKGKNQCDCPKH